MMKGMKAARSSRRQRAKVAAIRFCGRRDQRVDRAVAVVGREQRVVGVGEVGDLLAHGDAIPRKVGHDYVLGVALQERLEAVKPEQALAGADGRLRALPDHAQGLGVKRFGAGGRYGGEARRLRTGLAGRARRLRTSLGRGHPGHALLS